jgi:hypothetical protein
MEVSPGKCYHVYEALSRAYFSHSDPFMTREYTVGPAWAIAYSYDSYLVITTDCKREIRAAKKSRHSLNLGNAVPSENGSHR